MASWRSGAPSVDIIRRSWMMSRPSAVAATSTHSTTGEERSMAKRRRLVTPPNETPVRLDPTAAYGWDASKSTMEPRTKGGHLTWATTTSEELSSRPDVASSIAVVQTRPASAKPAVGGRSAAEPNNHDPTGPLAATYASASPATADESGRQRAAATSARARAVISDVVSPSHLVPL